MKGDRLTEHKFNSSNQHSPDIYFGIKIKWDDDHDTRIYSAIEKIIKLAQGDYEALSAILWVRETKANLTIAIDDSWDGELAAGYLEEFAQRGFDVIDGDYWTINIEFPNGKFDHDKFLRQSSKVTQPSRIVDKQDRYEVLKRQKWVCNICHTKLKYSLNSDWDGEVAHIDHIHPFSDAINYVGGSEKINESSNLQALCPKCNLGKGKKKGW